MPRKSTRVVSSTKQTSRGSRAGSSRETPESVGPGRKLIDGNLSTIKSTSEQTTRQPSKSSRSDSFAPLPPAQSATVTADFEPTLQLEPTQELRPSPSPSPMKTKQSKQIEPVQLEPTQELSPSPSPSHMKAKHINEFEPTLELEPSVVIHPSWPTQDLGVSQIAPPTQLIPSQDLAEDVGIKGPQTLEDWVKLGSAVKRQKHGSTATSTAPHVRSKQRFNRHSHSSDDQSSKRRSKHMRGLVAGPGFEVPESVAMQVLERSTKKRRVHHGIDSATPVATQTLEIEPTQYLSSKHVQDSKTNQKDEVAPLRIWKSGESATVETTQASHHLRAMKGSSQEFGSSTPVPTRTLDIEPTQYISPEEVARTQQLTPTQNLTSLQLSPPTCRNEPAVIPGLFGRSTALSWNPLAGSSGALPVKRSFKDLVRLGLKNRGRSLGQESPPPEDAAYSDGVDSKDASPQMDRLLELKDVGSDVRDKCEGQVDPRNNHCDMAQHGQGEVESRDSHGVAHPSAAGRADEKNETKHNIDEISGNCGSAADAFAKSSLGETASHNPLVNDVASRVAGSLQPSTLPPLCLQSSESLLAEKTCADEQPQKDALQATIGSAPAENITVDQQSPKDPLRAIIEERAAEGLQRVVAAEELARQLAERQRAVTGVYRALMELI